MKIAASLNEEHDAYIIDRLPAEGRSEIIKAALILFFRVQEGELAITDPAEVSNNTTPESRRVQAAAPVVVDTSGIERAIRDGAERIAQMLAGGQIVVQSNGNGNGHHAEANPEEDREDPNDPLVLSMLGLNFDKL